MLIFPFFLFKWNIFRILLPPTGVQTLGICLLLKPTVIREGRQRGVSLVILKRGTAGWPDCVNSAGTSPPSGSVPPPAMTSKLDKFGRLAALPWHWEVYMKLGTMTHEWARSERVAEQLSQSPQSLLTERVGEGLIWQPVSCNPPKQLWNHKDPHCLKRSHHLC